MADRRDNPWRLTPPLIIQIVILAFGIGGFYLVSERRTTTLEATLESAVTSWDRTATEIKTQITSLDNSVRMTSKDSASQQSDLAARGREIEDLKRTFETLSVKVSVMEKDIARLQAAKSR